ncbi:hypothetical protein O7632_07985 [Solwaraspora sp. WMMD406]|uniref:effector-associated constant component EACC1 n=1 Tax=Solwaraspora sp. WMMD406 TaxID=3016095 RepID=UPI002417B720|nr:hypothetical protein [Solwaraspora sp. WMMD406]MDG4764044.1 hypothetical protein [Solwaraspora sp. WMMD406]
MDLSLTVHHDDAPQLVRDLRQWLAAEPELSGRVRLESAPPQRGELGILELLIVALGAGGVLSVLAESLQTWFAQPRRSDVRITVRTAAGDVIEIDAKRVKQVERLIEQALAADASARPEIGGDAAH